MVDATENESTCGQHNSDEVPPVLFRYMKFEYLEPILKGRGLFFPKLSSFNDPFDAYIFPSFGAHARSGTPTSALVLIRLTCSSKMPVRSSIRRTTLI